MIKFSLTIASFCAAISLGSSAPTSPRTATDRISHFLDAICSKLGINWVSQWKASSSQSQRERRTVFVTGSELHLLFTVFEAMDETDFETVFNETKNQLIAERNNTESDKGLDLPMLFIIFRFVFEQYETATNHSHKQSMILSQWLVEALELVRPVNEIMSGQQTVNEVRS